MKFAFSFFLLLIGFSANGQLVEIADLHEDGTFSKSILKVNLTQQESLRSGFNQLSGFPVGKPAHPNFKNFRNVSLADLNDDGRKEIIVCLNETLFVFTSSGEILWQAQLAGTSNFPPAIGDIDNDGDLEIALQTYGVPAVGNVYVFNHRGDLLSGWPINFDNHFFLNGVTLANIDQEDDLEIIASERINSNSGRVHALKIDGSSINANWPITIPGTPAFTPSIADINQDGKPEIVTSTTTQLFVFNADGNIATGFPAEEPGSKFSYQSPLLADLNQDENLEIITARHNDLPGTVVFNQEGADYGQWPDYDNIWTFATPAVVDIDADGDFEVFYARPHISETTPGDVVLGYDHLGNRLEDFQIIDLIGSEGLVSIADIDQDGDYEILTASKGTIDGKGLIHAYHFESGNEVSNFPLLVEGFTFINGAFLSDINQDGKLDLTALSYQLKFDANNRDSAFINVFDLQVPYRESDILFNGYKGDLTHDGRIENQMPSSVDAAQLESIGLSPNPVREELFILNVEKGNANQAIEIFDFSGRKIRTISSFEKRINVKGLPAGKYYLKMDGQLASFIKI